MANPVVLAIRQYTIDPVTETPITVPAGIWAQNWKMYNKDAANGFIVRSTAADSTRESDQPEGAVFELANQSPVNARYNPGDSVAIILSVAGVGPLVVLFYA